MGVVYPQYWLQVNVDIIVFHLLEVLKEFYDNPHPCGDVTNDKLTPIPWCS
jgi:hypothetical protein